MVRTVVMLPESYRQAIRVESEERGVDMGQVIAELVENNDLLMSAVRRIRKRREEENKRGK